MRNWSLQTKIFATFSVLVLLIMACFVSVLVAYASRMIQSEVDSGTERLLQKITEQFDGMVQDMVRINVSLLMDEALSSRLYSPASIPALGFQEKRELANSIYSINGPFSSAYKIVVFNFDYQYALSPQSVDNADALFRSGIEGVPILAPLQDSDGSFRLLPPHLDSWSQLQIPVFSIGSKIMDTAGREYGYVEVQQRYTDLKGLYDPNPDVDSTFYIFDSEGQLFYPQPFFEASAPAGEQALFQSLGFQGGSGSATVWNEHGEARLVTYQQSPLTGHVMVISQSRTQALAPVRRLSMLIVGAGLLFLLATLFVLHRSSRRLTMPLRTLGQSLKQVSLSNMAVMIEHTDKHNELQLLDRMFKKLFARLQDSIEQLTEANEREAKAQLLALQSQINPHFIHNTLATIGAAAKHPEEREKVVEMCHQLSALLRYTTASDECVRVEDELEYTRHYLHLLKYRYEEYFSFDMEVDRELWSMVLPRITVQPLVENAMKHAFAAVPPPWHISITGHAANGRWEIAVCDNGTGMEEELLEALRGQIQAAVVPHHRRTVREAPDGEQGLGIVNTYARLLLLHGNQAYMKLDNMPGRGFRVAIGGVMKSGLEAAHVQSDDR